MTYVPAKRGAEYVFYTALINRGDTGTFKVNPTLAVGDVTVSLGDGAKANIATLPVVTPAGSEWVKVTLSAAEMTSDIDKVLFNDVAGAEWCAQAHTIPTAARQIDDLSTLTAAQVNAEVLDTADAIETGWTLRKALRVILAAVAGKSSGHSTNAPVYRNVTDTKARITATTTADGRATVTLDGD